LSHESAIGTKKHYALRLLRVYIYMYMNTREITLDIYKTKKKKKKIKNRYAVLTG